MPIVAGILEVVDSPLYDTVALPMPHSPDADIPPATLFVEPLGCMSRVWPGVMRPKSEHETNLFEPGLLVPPQKFLVRSIRAAFFGYGGELMPANSIYYRAATLRFEIRAKAYWQGPLWKVADPATMFFSADSLKLFEVEERHELIRSLRHQFEKDLTPLIEAQEPFGCRVTFDPIVKWDAVNAPRGLVVLLEGTLARPVV